MESTESSRLIPAVKSNWDGNSAPQVIVTSYNGHTGKMMIWDGGNEPLPVFCLAIVDIEIKAIDDAVSNPDTFTMLSTPGS